MERVLELLAATPHPAHEPHDAGDIRPVRRARTLTIVGFVAVVGCLLAVAVVAGTLRRAANARALTDVVRRAAEPPVVDVIRPQPAPVSRLSLPGTTQAFAQAIIYARTSGYLKNRYADIGDVVKAGQLLAEIESPEIDQQFAQARAQLQQSIKNLELQQSQLDIARITMNRYTAADRENAVAKEMVDQQVAAYRTAGAAVAAAQAAVDSAKANLDRFQQLTSFERVLAPFDGTITQRNVDAGDLITAGSPTNNVGAAPTTVTGGASGLFQISQVNTLRVFVSVPQVYAPNITTGLAARVVVRGQLAKPFAATVTRTANALDPGTRTLLTEVDVANPGRTLFPGMFVYVDFDIAPAGSHFRLPSTAVVVDGQGTRVMVVDRDGTLHERPVVFGRDFGDAVDVQGGLTGNESIVKQPTVSLQEGQHVTPRESKAGAS